MTDFIDQAIDREQDIADAVLANRPKYVGSSAYECEECGYDIPEGRRQAVPGCTKCVHCASVEERRR